MDGGRASTYGSLRQTSAPPKSRWTNDEDAAETDMRRPATSERSSANLEGDVVIVFGAGPRRERGRPSRRADGRPAG